MLLRGTMARYVARKLLHTIAVLFLVSVATVLLLDLTPGDPASAILGTSATPEAVRAVHKELHLDQPFYSRYGDWVGDLVQGDFGTSYRTKESVSTIIVDALPVTIEILVLVMLLSMLISVPLGIYCAQRVGGRLDRANTFLSSILVSIPAFVSVPVLVYLLVLQAHVFPATGWVKLTDDLGENLWHLVLPVVALTLAEVPIWTASLRADMISTLQEDFILNARAKGVPERRVLFRHALRPSSFSLLTIVGLRVGAIISAAVVVEVLFSLPGLGTVTVSAITAKDLPVVQGVVMFVALMWVLLNTLTDVAYTALDPRVRAAAGH
jgi:peptide/nickel transport system permease protein